VYTIVAYTVEKTVTASDGQDYLVSVTYSSDSGVPADAALEVTELLADTPEYENYVNRAAEALGQEVERLSFAHAFNIALVNASTGEHYQPTRPVKVSVALYNEDIQEGDSIDVVHFPDSPAKKVLFKDAATPKADILQTNVNGETVEFESDGFSVYVVCAYTVDFHWSD
jgi:hypothetical protein